MAYLDEALAHIRAGKANPKIIDGIKVEYYGSAVPVSQVANVAVPDARTITITPWEKQMFKEIEKAIINSELGITPENNGEVIRISIPPLTEERRKQLVKQSKAEAEQAKCLCATPAAMQLTVSKRLSSRECRRMWRKMQKLLCRRFTISI